MAETDKNFSGVTIPISNEGDGCLFHPQKILAYYLYGIFHYLLYPYNGSLTTSPDMCKDSWLYQSTCSYIS